MYVCVYPCIYLCVYMHVSLCECMYLCIIGCMYACVNVCIYTLHTNQISFHWSTTRVFSLNPVRQEKSQVYTKCPVHARIMPWFLNVSLKFYWISISGICIEVFVLIISLKKIATQGLTLFHYFRSIVSGERAWCLVI